MSSIPRLSRILRQLFFRDASKLAYDYGVIQRMRVFSGASLLQLLVFGWLKEPQAGSSALARFAGGLGLKVSKHAIEERFTMHTAQWLLAVLRQGVQYLVCAQAVSLPLLQRFPAVLLEDGSTITLPASLKQVWRGCGGSGPETALKLTVRWDLLTGGLRGPYLQEGRRHETQSPLREQQMPHGSLWVGDLGVLLTAVVAAVGQARSVFLAGIQGTADGVACPGQAGRCAGLASDPGAPGAGCRSHLRGRQASACAAHRQTDA